MFTFGTLSNRLGRGDEKILETSKHLLSLLSRPRVGLCPGRCCLAMRYSCRARGHVKRGAMYFTCNISHLHSAVKLPLCTPLGRWGKGGRATLIFDFGTIWVGWSASRPDRYTPRDGVSGTHCNIRLGGSQNRPGRYGGEKCIILGSNGKIPRAQSP